MKTAEIQVVSLHIYPLKSAQGIALNEMEIIQTGPRWDRQWMVVDSQGNFVSQRKHPKMCLIRQQLSSDELHLHAPQMESLKINILAEPQTTSVSAKIFNSEVLGQTVNSSANQWFSDYLGEAVTLVRAPSPSQRHTSQKYDSTQTPILYPDGFPFLLTSTETLAELNSKLPEPVMMNRFRPNIVIQGGGANQEDQWRKIKIGNVTLNCVKACTRCNVITVEQETAKTNNQVMRTLLDYRRKDGKVVFGQNLVHENYGIIKIKDKITVLATD